MTSHQDNAARLARIAQIGALVVILVAVGAFLIPMPAKDVSPGAGTNQPGGANPEQPPAEKFHVPEEDWSIALAPLGDARDPVVAVAGGPKGGPGGQAETSPLHPRRRTSRIARRSATSAHSAMTRAWPH